MSEKNRIPKIIHYVWFGRGKKNSQIEKCIESWRKYLPEYEIIEWNEDNFELNLYEFTKEAYKEKKYAYVSDVVRLHVLYHYGGIYMDTDVEVLKPLDNLLHEHAFSGFQMIDQIPTGIMASEPKNQWYKEQLDYYKDKKFSLNEVEEKHITNVDIITRISVEKHGLILNNNYQVLKYGMAIYPMDYFCAKSPSTGKIAVTNNTYTIHHFAGSWVPRKALRHKALFRMCCKILGEDTAKRLLRKMRNLTNE